MTDQTPEDATRAPSDSEEDPDDSYMDGPYLVFTEAYHLRRGYCCQSGCRHCPYGFVLPTAGAAAVPPGGGEPA